MKEHASRHAELGNFLKTRRANITPAQIGLPAGIRRRTPGLRREEVAALAGIGLTWYTWLEQGRDIQVSPQVIHSLARVLMLNEEETHHLYVLANQPVPLQPPPYRQIVPAALQRILDSLPFSPSLILDTRWNILAWNTAATAVFTDFQAIDIASRNYIWLMFTNPHYWLPRRHPVSLPNYCPPPPPPHWTFCRHDGSRQPQCDSPGQAGIPGTARHSCCCIVHKASPFPHSIYFRYQ
jgi:transcriptional regulator with XRE-family HTH domain